MAKLVFGLNQSLERPTCSTTRTFAPGPSLFRHFTEQVRPWRSAYGCCMNQVMRYWDEESEWTRRHFAAAWRTKWVVSRSLKSVGPNATCRG